MRAQVLACVVLASFFVMTLTSPADAGNGANWVLYNHHTADQGETEVKIFSDFSDAGKPNADYSAQLLEIEYGVTDRLTTALYFEGVDLDGQNYDFGSWRFETRYRLFEYGTVFLNPVLYVEYEQPEPEHRFIRSVTGRTDGGEEGEEDEKGTEHELETKLLLGHDFSDRFNVAFNWINEVNLDNGNWSFGYALGFNYTLFHSEIEEDAAEEKEHFGSGGWELEKVKLGGELYGGLGDDSLGLTLDSDKTKQYIGLNLQGEFENHISFGVGGAIGLTSDSEDAILRLLVGYEFE